MLLFVITPTYANINPNLNNPLECMAANIYHEARGESLRDKLSVGHVVLNRLRNIKWPKTICSVIKQRGQFVWYGKRSKIKEMQVWSEIVELSKRILDNRTTDPTKGATFFHKGKNGHHVYYR